MAYQKIWKNEPNITENEKLKLAKDGLCIFDEIDELCKKPFEEILKSDYMYFKYAGLTLQKPSTDGLFMFRVKIPAGIITFNQAKRLAWLASTYGKGILDLTTRQSVQVHWVPFEQLSDIFKQLEKDGLTTSEAEGDVPRNIIGNPMADIDPDELFECSDLIQQINDFLQNNEDYSNLPRKFKISISTNYWNAANAQIQDIAFTPATKMQNGIQVNGFDVYVGGGLGAVPRLGKPLNMFVQPKDVMPVIEGVLALYREYGNRTNRKRARLKFLVEDWGFERFEEELRAIVGPLPTAGKSELKGWHYGMVQKFAPQKQAGYYTAAIRIPAGRITSEDFESYAELAARYGTGEMRIDHAQNLLIPNISKDNLEDFEKEPVVQKYGFIQNNLLSYGMSCTGNEFCNMAFTETKALLKTTLELLDQKLELDVPVRIIINGCPNNCGHRSIADIGLLGVSKKNSEGTPCEAFSISLGGYLADEGAFTKRMDSIIEKKQLAVFLEQFLTYFKETKQKDESFYQFYERMGHEQLNTQIKKIVDSL